jgi:hypothetical protein
MRHIAGAYPAAPLELSDRHAQAAFLRRLAESPHVEGLELPYLDQTSVGERWPLDLMPDRWEHVVTAAPATAVRSRAEPRFGLASTDEDGRHDAVGVAHGVRDAVERLVQRAGRPTVIAVEVHSAPPANGSAGQLARSLIELADWDWSGARLVIEHCDAVAGPHPPEKGYLSLEAEIEAVTAVNEHTGAGMGVAVNWGRSVIEARSPQGATEHVARAAGTPLLSGIVFSGVAATPIGAVPAWADAHLPPRPLEPASLLGEAEIRQTLAHAGPALADLDYLGVKVGARRGDVTPAERARTVCRALEMVIAAREALGVTG